MQRGGQTCPYRARLPLQGQLAILHCLPGTYIAATPLLGTAHNQEACRCRKRDKDNAQYKWCFSMLKRTSFGDTALLTALSQLQGELLP